MLALGTEVPDAAALGPAGANGANGAGAGGCGGSKLRNCAGDWPEDCAELCAGAKTAIAATAKTAATS